ncbi:MAG TPA: PSD1 and planctomycete cytochrome C domain-containing protein [Verrucomicrobiae bacterium]|nr:PSD1 and planctomycete cytochrome C domain-containing protein [Verrucomicrobiae bacterium]
MKRCRTHFVSKSLIGFAVFLMALANGIAAEVPKIDFTKDVRPILANHCFKCHGPDEGARKAKLRLDVRAEAIKPAKSGEKAIVPSKPDKSELIARIFTEVEEDIMPPAPAKRPLSPAQKEILKRWIAEGAEYKTHWAFIAPQQASLPKIRDQAWPRNPIDYFVLARLEKEGLSPAPAADKYTLVRRVYLDLTGLPPTPEQADAFVNDTSPEAYERLVDQLLASPAYGERWARRWLDLARYADTNGYEKDRPRSIWAWRDWVINALNADMPFDEFTIEQLAGDMLPNATRDQIIATGFHRNTMINEEGGIDTLEYRFLSMVDRVHVTSTAWLGLTMACAQCHTHKYDPIQQTEYYSFMAFLNNASEPTFSIADPAIVEKRKKVQSRIAALEAALPDQFPVPARIAWQIPGNAEFSSKNGSEAEYLSDGSFRLSGAGPDKDVYTIRFDAAKQTITHVQVEAIPDESLSKGGPGRSDSGNFVLTALQLEVQEMGAEAKPKTIKFASAEADFSQDKFPAENLVDGKGNTGWAVGGPGGGAKHRHVILALAEPVELTNPASLTVRLVQNYGSRHTLGRFRISVGNELTDRIVDAGRRRELRDQKFEKWLVAQSKGVAGWKVLRPAAMTSSTPILTLQADDSIFASGDFTKNDTYQLTFRNLPADLKAIRLEMLPDERLPDGGPGSVAYEGPEGDFWVSAVKVKADGRGVTLTNATESFANAGNNAAKAIDDDLQSGWSIDGGQGKAHNAVFQFGERVSPTNELVLEVVCERYYAAGLGRFRVWVTTDADARASAMENEAVAILAKNRDKEKLRTLLTDPNRWVERELLLRQFANLSADFSKPRREIEKLQKEMPKFPTTLVMQERPPGHERATFRHHRGEYLQPKEEVSPEVPAFLPPLARNAPKNRLTLAQWLVSGQNPLTGRVVMNRHWEAFFGRGLVRTTEDFGFQGELPSHPELLDWLAVEFVKQGWSQKKMHQLIVMSATYQQSSAVTSELRERDPLNVLLARGPRLRLEAEMVRDAALVASGLLSDKVGGPGVFPPQPPGVSSEGAYGVLEWKTSQGPDRYRRGLYTFAKRTAPYAMTATFDAPSGEACLARRERANTPLQALTLLNDTVFMECARALGQMAVNAGGDEGKRGDLLFRRCLTRPPNPDEIGRLKKFYETQLGRFAGGELKATEILDVKDGERLDEQAAWTTVARVLLNLDETITKN